jgi:hypothetical protein
MEFFTVSLGNILTIVSFILGGLAFIWSMKGDLKISSMRLTNIEVEITELRKVIVTMARQEERINSMDERLLAQGKRVDAQGDRITSIDRRVFAWESRASNKAQ